MRRAFAILLMLTMVIFMVSCGNANSSNESPENQTAPSENNELAASVDNNVQTEETESNGTQTGDGSDHAADSDSAQEQGTDDPENSDSSQDNLIPDVSEATVSEPEASEQTSDSKILVAYFSRVGNTVWESGVDAVTSASLNVVDGEFAGNAQLLAQMAQQVTGGDLFLIQTEDTYPSNYRETTNQASVEQADDARPSLSSHVEDMDSYDTIVLVYPNWWGTLPQPLFTFLEEYDFSGKTILPLCTHEGSRMGSSERAIAQLCPDAVLLDGLSVRGSSAASAQSDVDAWINDSGILDVG